VSTAPHKYRQGLAGVLVAASLWLGASAAAQQAPAQQPPAQQPAAQAAPQPQVQLSNLRQTVQRLRDQERQQAQEREQRFRAEMQRMERQATEAVQRSNAAEARSNALDSQWTQNEQTIAETNTLLA